MANLDVDLSEARELMRVMQGMSKLGVSAQMAEYEEKPPEERAKKLRMQKMVLAGKLGQLRTDAKDAPAG